MRLFYLFYVFPLLSPVSNDSEYSSSSGEVEWTTESTTTTQNILEGKLDSVVKKRFNIYLKDKTGLKNPIRWALYRRYKFPANVKSAKGPVLNRVIASALTASCRDRDKSIRARQDTLGHALSALGEALNHIPDKKDSELPPEVVGNLIDAVKLLTDVHVVYTKVRRNLIIPIVTRKYTQTLEQAQRNGDKLFGGIDSQLKGHFGNLTSIGTVECSAGCLLGKNVTKPKGKDNPIFGCGQAKVYLKQTIIPPVSGVTLMRFSSTRRVIADGPPNSFESDIQLVKVEPPRTKKPTTPPSDSND